MGRRECLRRKCRTRRRERLERWKSKHHGAVAQRLTHSIAL